MGGSFGSECLLSKRIPVFAKREIHLMNQIKQVMTSTCPNLFKTINQYKRLGNEVLPILLQRIESYIIIDRVAPRIPRHVPFWTVHDSILTLPEHTNQIRELIEEEFLIATGFNPIIRIK